MTPRIQGLVLMFAALLVARGGVFAESPGVEPARTLADCDTLVRDDPDDLASYACFWLVPQRTGEWEAAVRRLEGLLAISPESPRVQLYLALTRAYAGNTDVEELYRAAIDGFASEGHLAGEAWSRESLAIFLTFRNRRTEAAEEFERALAVARRAGEPWVEVRILTRAGWNKSYLSEYGAAWRMLKQAESLLTPDTPHLVALDTYDGLAAVAWGIGRYEESLAYYDRELELLGEGAAAREADIRTNLVLVAKAMFRRGRLSRDELILYRRRSLEAAERAGNRYAQARSHFFLAEDLQVPEALPHVRAGLALLPETARARDRAWGLWLLAEMSLDPQDPEPALEALREADQLVRAEGDLWGIARGKMVSAVIHGKVGLLDRAIAEETAAIEIAEIVRDLQHDRESRARVFSRFADAYRSLGAYHLRKDSGPAGVERCFDVMERFRARVLLDALDAAGVEEALGAGAGARELRTTVLEQIAETQRQLMSPKLSQERRRTLLAQLEGLEGQESALLEEMLRSNPKVAAIREPTIPRLDEIQEALAVDQAIIAYQYVAEDVDFSWAVVITRNRAEALALSARSPSQLARDISLLKALLERRDGTEGPGAARLYDELLKDAIDSLPPGVTKLLIVPDLILHRVPFDALRSEPQGQPLVARYDISVIPSATSWLRWKAREPDERPRSALVLADPVLLADERDELRTAALFATGLRLGRLPHARREARAMSRLGDASRVLIGDRATEHAIKTADLENYRVIHIAAHAMVDDERPERSAVVLSPGHPAEDGLLQFREIVDLELDGQVVVLSACQGAAGPVIAGEGVLGLANAFFYAGASTVVAGLWPLRDDEVSALVEAFAGRIAEGRTVASSLSMAKRDLMARGVPPAAWAGVLVLGDGDLVPVPGGVRAFETWELAGLAGALVVVVGLAAWLRYRRTA